MIAYKKIIQRPVLLLFIFGLFLILCLFLKFHLADWVIGSDGLGYYAYLRSLFVDGDLQLSNEFLEYNPFGHAVPNPHLRTATDHVPNKYFIGPALLWTPFFLVAHVLTILANQFGFHLKPDGYSAIYQFFIGFGSIVYGLAGLILIYKITLRFFQRNEALIATSFIALGTNVFYYLTSEPSMSHSMSMFAVSLFVFIWVRDIDYRQKSSVFLLALTAGLMILIRAQNILFLVFLILEWIGFMTNNNSDFVSGFRKKITEIGVFGLALLITLLPQFVIWKILYGHFLFYSYEGEAFNFANPHLLDSLFSARHGLIIWTPGILLALAGVFHFPWKQAKFGIALIVAFILQWYLNASWQYWWFGHSFGGRAYINCSFIFAIGMAMFLTATKKWAVPTRFFLAALVGWNLLFAAQYTLGMLPHGEAVDFKQILYNQFNLFGKIFSVFF